MPNTEQPYQIIILGQDVFQAIKINANVAEGVFQWQGIIKLMPQYGHWISTKASTFYDDNPKLALLSVFSQQDDFLQDNKMVIRKLKNLCFS